MSSTLCAKWTRLPLQAAAKLQLSSHALAVVGSTAYVFGGELVPRTPVPASLTLVSLPDGTTRTLHPAPGSAWPAPRVGAALVAHGRTLYLWGGRGGKDMGTFSPESEDLWAFDTATEAWTALSTSGDKPEQRSFHVLTIAGDTLYLHAGCPPKGRLPTLHALSLSALLWSALPSAPGPGRGGTAFTTLADGTLARFGGFAGVELGGLDVFSPRTAAWEEQKAEEDQPDKRSVAGFEALSPSGLEEVRAVLFLGEREGAPAELGHDGAGAFHSDAWALLEGGKWAKLRSVGAGPEPRGWFAAARWGADKIVVQGGLNERNERLEDMWVLEVVRE